MYWNCATYILLRYNRENSYNISWLGVVLEKLSTGTQTIFLSNKKTFITFYAAFVSDYFFTFFSTSKWKKYIWDQEMLNWHIKIDRKIYIFIYMQRIQNDQIKNSFVPVSRMTYLNMIFYLTVNYLEILGTNPTVAECRLF